MKKQTVKPSFILFDYGQTLVTEGSYDGARGYDVILRQATSNPNGVTGEQLQREVEKINRELGRFDPATRHKRLTEMTEESISRLLFAKYGIRFDCDLRELELPFWNAANPCQPTDGICNLLDFLKEESIRTGVVSNLSFCGKTLRGRIAGCIPNADFDFVISSCDYLFRKPSKHIFEAALVQTGVSADKVWFCGDQFLPDIQGASSAGMTPVWYKAFLRYDQECRIIDGGIEINSWEELKEIIRSTR